MNEKKSIIQPVGVLGQKTKRFLNRNRNRDYHSVCAFLQKESKYVKIGAIKYRENIQKTRESLGLA